METFRQLIRGWLGKALLVFFLAIMALTGFSAYESNGSGKDATVVKVNGDKINESVVSNAVANQRQKLLQQVQGDESLINNAALRKSVIDSLVARTVLLQQAKKLGFELSDQQVSQIIQQDPTFQVDGKYSDSLFQTQLRASGMSLNQLLSEVREQAALKQLAGGISDTSVISKADVDNLVKLQTEKRQVHMASLPISGFAEGINITAQQIANYYNKNKTSLKTVENADVDYVILDAAAFTPLVKLTEADIQAQYKTYNEKSTSAEERHIQHILIEVNAKTNDAVAKKQIEQIAARVKAGEDFGALAKQFSQDAGSAAQNGDLGFLAKGSFPGAFDDTAFALAVNEVSAPVKSSAGYHLIKVLEVKKSDAPALASIRPQLEQQAQQAKLEELYSDAVNRLNDMAVDTDSLADLAKAQQLSVASAKAVSVSTQVAPLNDATVKQAIFNDDVVNGDRKVSTGIQFDATHTIWLKVANYRPVRQQTLAEATPVIKQKLEHDAMVAKAQAKAKLVIEAFKTKSPQVVQQENAIVFQSLGELTRMSGAPQYITRAAFSLPKPAQDKWTASQTKQGENLFIVAVASVDAGDLASVPAQDRQQLANLLSGVRGQQDVADYAQYLKSKAKIKGLKEAEAVKDTDGK